MIKYEESAEFKKSFPSLPEDFAIVKKAVIELRHIKQINNLSTFEIPGFLSPESSCWKIKKFACKSLKGRGVKSGLRVIYRWHESVSKVFLVEIYFKGDQENENRELLKKYTL